MHLKSFIINIVPACLPACLSVCHATTTIHIVYKFYFSAGNKLKCFECNSHKDEYCADPFNWTTLPPIQVCEGCCVKIVQGMGTRKS